MCQTPDTGTKSPPAFTNTRGHSSIWNLRHENKSAEICHERYNNMLMDPSHLHELYRLNVRSVASIMLVLLLNAQRNVTFWILANSGNTVNQLNVKKPQVLTMKREESALGNFAALFVILVFLAACQQL